MNKIMLSSVLFAGMLLLSACGAKSDNKGSTALAQKKAELDKLKTQQQEVNTSILKLQEEIFKLDPASKPEKTKLVTIKPIEPISFVHYIDLQGNVAADDISYVAPRNGAGGLVRSVFIKKGEYVKKGQQVLKLDDAVYLKNLKQAESQLSFAKDLYNRQKNLWDQNIGTEVQLISAKNNVTSLEDQIATIKEQWSMTNVYADASGTADIVNIRPGELFTGFAGQTPQIAIVNNTNLKLKVQVPENYISKITNGSSMVVTFPDINKTYNTKISISGNYIDPNSRSFFVEAKLPADKNIKPNQVAQVSIQDYSAANAITAPVNTLQTDEKGKFILVAANENGKLLARKKAVTTGQLYKDIIEITSGLQQGDKVITEGYQGLYDGQLLTTAVQ